MKIVMKTAVIALLMAGSRGPVARGDEAAEEAARERIGKRVERLLEESGERLRREVAELIRREFRKPVGETDPVAPLESALGSVETDRLRRHLSALSADEMEGRHMGQPGERRAAEYIAGVFKKAGLLPAGDAGTFFQSFDVGSSETQNVLGMIEGSDPDLRHEIVVLGGHHDHLGTMKGPRHFGRLGRASEEDGIWNGADDNASGVTAVMGIAEAMMQAGIRPKRTVVFITFSGEETGLHGSRHYTGNPVGKIEDHVFMLNFDMVGRNPGNPLRVEGIFSDETPLLERVVREAVAAEKLAANFPQQGMGFAGSDHSAFKARSVPAIFMFSGMHRDYHRVTDHADLIDYDRLAAVVRAGLRITEGIADAPERPKFKTRAPSRNREPRATPSRRTLGVRAEMLAEGERSGLGLDSSTGVMRIESVMAGSVAETSGIEQGDLLYAVGGEALPAEGTMFELVRRLKAAKAGVPLKLAIIRGDQRLELNAVWEK